MHSDQKYITYLRQHHSGGIDEIYQQFAPKVKRMILANNGSEQEAADVFQESLIDIFKLSQKADFTLTCSFEAFLIIVCKRKWLSVLKSARKKKVTNAGDELSAYGADVQIAEDYADEIERENTIVALLERLEEKCRTLIKACMKERRQKIVAENLGVSYAYLRKRKSLCMAKLAGLVKEHPLFNH